MSLLREKKFSLGLEPRYPILLHQKNFFCGCYGEVQDQDIRTQLEERITKIYNMSMFWEKKFFLVRPRAGLTYTTTAKKYFFCGNHGDVQDRDIRTQLEERITKIYNMSMFWEKKFVRPRNYRNTTMEYPLLIYINSIIGSKISNLGVLILQ